MVGDVIDMLSHVASESSQHMNQGAVANAGGEPVDHDTDICASCPFCTAMRMFQETRPEVVEHMASAVEHVTRAFQAFALGAPAEGAEAPEQPPLDAELPQARTVGYDR